MLEEMDQADIVQREAKYTSLASFLSAFSASSLFFFSTFSALDFCAFSFRNMLLIEPMVECDMVDDVSADMAFSE